MRNFRPTSTSWLQCRFKHSHFRLTRTADRKGSAWIYPRQTHVPQQALGSEFFIPVSQTARTSYISHLKTPDSLLKTHTLLQRFRQLDTGPVNLPWHRKYENSDLVIIWFSGGHFARRARPRTARSVIVSAFPENSFRSTLLAVAADFSVLR